MTACARLVGACGRRAAASSSAPSREGKGEEEFSADIQFLVRLWQQVQARFERRGRRAPLHEEIDLMFRVVRDLFSPDVDEFVIDDQETYDKCVEYVDSAGARSRSPGRALRRAGADLRRASASRRRSRRPLRRRVWLKSGGYIVIDQTEALIAIDVNTGKYVGKRDSRGDGPQDQPRGRWREIVRQLRLRNIGGIIIIDFIDMDREEHRDKVFRALKRGAGRRQGANQRARDLRARPGRDDAQARAAEPALAF